MKRDKNTQPIDKRLVRRLLSFILSLLLVLSGMPATAIAEEVFSSGNLEAQELLLDENELGEEVAEAEPTDTEGEWVDTEGEDDFGPVDEAADEAVTVADFAAQAAENAGEGAGEAALAEAAYDLMVAAVVPVGDARDVAAEDVLAGRPADALSIARALSDVLAELGIESDVLVADADGSVAWTAAKVGGAWLHLDVAQGARELADDEAEPWRLLADEELLARDAARSPWHALDGVWEPAAEGEPEAEVPAEETTEEAETVATEEGAEEEIAERSGGAHATSDAVNPSEDGEIRALSSELNICIYQNHEMRIGWDLPDTYNGYGIYDAWYHEHADDTGGLDTTYSRLPWQDYASYVTKVTVVGNVRVENASNLFRGMSSVTSMNLSKLDMSGCSTTTGMFYGCSNLKSLDISGWSMNYMDSSEMYEGCSSLASVKVGSGVYWSWGTRLPEYSVNGHTNWYSSTAKQWFTPTDIYCGRDHIADTYSKSIPARRDISTSRCKATIKTQAWTGKQIKPMPTVKWGSATLKKGTHFKVVKYGTNKNNGTKGNWVKIQGIGSYKGTRTVRFRIKRPNVSYKTYQQSFGGSSWSSNGTMSGKAGRSKRVEAFGVKLSNKPVTGSVQYRAYVQGKKWTSWASNGRLAGTTNQSRRAEAIQIKLTGNMAKKYNVWYRVYAQHFGWMGWAKNGATAGTSGYNYRLESIQVVLKPKGNTAPAASFKGAKRKTAAAYKKKSASAATYTYKFKRDTWSFQNYTTYISESAYEDVFGEGVGSSMWRNDNYGYAGGVCYGFTTSVGASVKNKYPSAASFGASNMYGIGKYSWSSSIDMSAANYIEHCYLLQSRSELARQRNAHKCTTSAKYENFVKAVRNHQKGGTPIGIAIVNSYGGGHSVFPIKISSNTSTTTVIDIYDNNYPDSLQKLTLKKSGGNYTDWTYSDGYFTSSNYDITYDAAAQCVTTSTMGKNAICSLDDNGMTLVSTNVDLQIVSGGKTYNLSPNNTSDLSMVNPILTTNENADGMMSYWVGFDTSNMVVKPLSKDAKISVATRSGSVEVNAKKGSSLRMSVSDHAKNSVRLEGKGGELVSVKYL